MDPGALHFLYVRFAPEVDSCVRELVRSGRDAEEVTSRVFADLTARIGSYEEDEEPFVTWLLRFARSTAQEHGAHHPFVDTVAGRPSP
jgi:DNA-directed RNA polymerase specialized sigma24 family protein